jgi:hypothetical protein
VATFDEIEDLAVRAPNRFQSAALSDPSGSACEHKHRLQRSVWHVVNEFHEIASLIRPGLQE